MTPTRGQLHLTASLNIPRGLTKDRTERSRERTPIVVELTVTTYERTVEKKEKSSTGKKGDPT